jgi:hypothetical protein
MNIARLALLVLTVLAIAAARWYPLSSRMLADSGRNVPTFRWHIITASIFFGVVIWFLARLLAS